MWCDVRQIMSKNWYLIEKSVTIFLKIRSSHKNELYCTNEHTTTKRCLLKQNFKHMNFQGALCLYKLDTNILLFQVACWIGDWSLVTAYDLREGGKGCCILNLLNFCWDSSCVSPELLSNKSFVLEHYFICWMLVVLFSV